MLVSDDSYLQKHLCLYLHIIFMASKGVRFLSTNIYIVS